MTSQNQCPLQWQSSITVRKELTLSQQDQKNNKEYPINRINAILSLNRALCCEVSPKLRCARINWDNDTVWLYFYYDGDISEEDDESAQCVATEVITDFPEYELKIEI